MKTIFKILALTVIVAGITNPSTKNASASEVKQPAIPIGQIQEETGVVTGIRPQYTTYPTEVPLLPVFASKNIKTRKSIKTQIDSRDLYAQILSNSKALEAQGTKEQIQQESPDRIKEFTPRRNGIAVDAAKTTLTLISTGKFEAENPITPSIYKYQYGSTPGNNQLGLNTLIARGVSNFKGSSKNRRINIHVATEKMRGVLVAPNGTFSFNKYVGDVSAEDGFVPEIVIKKDGLKPELGGGVCQVSSTIFRAVMASGMPILERKNHSFPVNHYAPQGTDATTYTGVVDFKFLNDTPGYILLWPHFPDEDTLIFDIYGTDDGRQVEVKAPVKFAFQENGTFKTHWERTVTLKGQHPRVDDLISTYLPASWFKKEEQFVTAPTAAVPPVDTTANPAPTNTTPPPPTN
jgi:vancomycin resistance protein YoaR